MDILCGKTKPDTGEILFKGQATKGLTEVEDSRI